MLFTMKLRDAKNYCVMLLKCVTSIRNSVPFHENFIIFQSFRPDSLYPYTYKFFSVYRCFSKICKRNPVRIILKNQCIYELLSKIYTDYSVNVRLAIRICNCHLKSWSVTFLWCDGKILTLRGTGWCYRLMLRCYTLMLRSYAPTLVRSCVTLHVYTDLNSSKRLIFIRTTIATAFLYSSDLYKMSRNYKNKIN